MRLLLLFWRVQEFGFSEVDGLFLDNLGFFGMLLLMTMVIAFVLHRLMSHLRLWILTSHIISLHHTFVDVLEWLLVTAMTVGLH